MLSSWWERCFRKMTEMILFHLKKKDFPSARIEMVSNIQNDAASIQTKLPDKPSKQQTFVWKRTSVNELVKAHTQSPAHWGHSLLQMIDKWLQEQRVCQAAWDEWQRVFVCSYRGRWGWRWPPSSPSCSPPDRCKHRRLLRSASSVWACGPPRSHAWDDDDTQTRWFPIPML